MYPHIITYLLTFINYQEQIIRTLLTLLTGKSLFNKPEETPVNKPYRKLQVDDLPMIETYEKLDYQLLLQEFLETNGKPLKPVKRRKTSTPVPTSLNCPRCGAPSDYLYANNGGKGQYQCKVCQCLFSKKNRFLKELTLKCPHCSKSLEKIKERKYFNVYKCKNNNCSYYKNKINGMSKKEKKQFKKDPQAFKVRYIFIQGITKETESGFISYLCVFSYLGTHLDLSCELWLICP